MKHRKPSNLLLLFVFLFTVTGSILAQNQFGGKPQYDILVRQYPDTFGTFRIELYPTVAPLHTENFDTLAKQGFYDSLAFHRVVSNFVIQGGDPNSKTGDPSTWGQGAPWQQNVPAEFNPIPHEREVIGAARSNDPNSATSQFYVNLVYNQHLDGAYTAYGRVISGMNVVDSVEAVPVNANDLPLNKVDMFISYVGIDSSAPASAPNLIAPADNATNILRDAQFSWSTVTPQDFILYRIQFSKQSDFSTIDHEADIGKNQTTYKPIDGIEQGYVTYYWRVQTNNGGNLTTSATRSFTTGIGIPNLTFPADDAMDVYLNTYLDWDDVSGATGYRVLVSTVPTIQIPTFLVIDTTVPNSIFLSPELESNRSYYWTVAALDNAIEGSSPDLFKFTSGSTINSLDRPTRNQPRAFPNPISEKLWIDGIQGENYKLRLVDTRGQLRLEGEIKVNQSIDVSHLDPGVYLVYLIGPRTNHYIKVLKN